MTARDAHAADASASKPSVSAVRVAADPGGRWRIGVIAKRTWVVSQGRCTLSPAQVPLVEEPLHDPQRAILVHDADVLLNRTRVDVVVDGHAYPPGGRTPCDAAVQIGAWSRVARVFGARRVDRDSMGRPQFTPPARAERVALSWENGYGGVDLAARADIGDPFEKAKLELELPADPRFGLFAYPRNPVGKGYVIEPTTQAFQACELPLVEDPTSLLTPETLVLGDFVRWPRGPRVAGFGWLPYAFFPRSALLGAPPLVYDGAHIPPSEFFEIRQGDLHEAAVRPDRSRAERMGFAVAQSSAIGMRLAQVLPGDTVALRHLHPREPLWTFAIPPELPKMVVRFASEEAIELPALVRTVLLQPDEDRLTLVWTGEAELTHPPGPRRMSTLEHAVLWNR
jgi:hypothetical protein